MDKHDFYNLPKELDAGVYSAALDLLLKTASVNDSIIAVYLMGGKAQIGISDLDPVIIYKNGASFKHIPYPLSAESKFIFTHRWLSFDEDSFKYFYYIFPWETANLRIIWGKEIEVSDPKHELSVPDYKFLMAFILFDTLINKLLLFPRYRLYKNLDIRRIVGELYSLNYTFYLIKEISGSLVGRDFSLEIAELRENWFVKTNEENYQRLNILLEKGIDLTLEIVGILDEFLRDCNLEIKGLPTFLNNRFRIIFSDHWSKDRFLDDFSRNYIKFYLPFINKSIENFSLVLPLSLGYFFVAYMQGKGDFSRRIRHLLKGESQTLVNSEGVRKHAVATNKIFMASCEYGFKMPFSYGIGAGNNLKGWITNAVLRLARIFKLNYRKHV